MHYSSRIESIKIRFNFLSLVEFFFGRGHSLVILKSLQHFCSRLRYPSLFFPIQ